jgi:hypothetical protein
MVTKSDIASKTGEGFSIPFSAGDGHCKRNPRKSAKIDSRSIIVDVSLRE